MKKIKVSSEIGVTLYMIGSKYKPIILNYLIENKTKRFNEMMRYMKPISQRTLTNQLRELEEDGLISRKIYAEVPPKVEYSITKKGKSLYKILEAMCEWGEKNIDERFEITNPQCLEYD
ncbi:helix-turn-helix domain-containing protein [Brachyspira intermedia]|uniref:winged helix-turn-helix transcriptional regulator n=1 Tax=Brachyspira intermedia TaxID=84377 RepID=UPI0030063EA6